MANKYDPEFLASLQNLALLAGYTGEVPENMPRLLQFHLQGDSAVTFFRKVIRVAFHDHVLHKASFEDSRSDCMSTVMEAMEKAREHNGYVYFPGLEYVKEASDRLPPVVKTVKRV